MGSPFLFLWITRYGVCLFANISEIYLENFKILNVSFYLLIYDATTLLQPQREDEMARVEAAGGRIIYWNGYRVLGVLAMSRAIGILLHLHQ